MLGKDLGTSVNYWTQHTCLCSGGTIDINVSEVIEIDEASSVSGPPLTHTDVLAVLLTSSDTNQVFSLSELTMPAGGPFGGTAVDREFTRLLSSCARKKRIPASSWLGDTRREFLAAKVIMRWTSQGVSYGTQPFLFPCRSHTTSQQTLVSLLEAHPRVPTPWTSRMYWRSGATSAAAAPSSSPGRRVSSRPLLTAARYVRYVCARCYELGRPVPIVGQVSFSQRRGMVSISMDAGVMASFFSPGGRQ